jgi:hypothetical protein
VRQKTAVATAAVAVVIFFLFTAPIAAQCSGGAGPQAGLAVVSCTGVPSWNPTGSYVSGTLVTYNGCLYRANQSFASNPGWCPGCAGVFIYGNGSACPAAGCNYGAQGACSAGDATPTAVPTATSTAASASPTPRATARPTATASAGYGYSVISSSSVRFHVNNAPWADVHYTINGAGQQDFRMAHDGSNNNTYTLLAIPAGAVVQYFFTIGDTNGGSSVTPWATFTMTVGGTATSRATATATATTSGRPTPTSPATGSGIVFQNNTHGFWSNGQIYVTMLGQVTPGQWYYMTSSGAPRHINVADETASGHLNKNGRNYANMSFTLAQASLIPLPSSWQGGRIYISLGSPLYVPIDPSNLGFGLPDLLNPADPNTDVYFDWYEFTFVLGQIPYGGNTTQVDMFGFPMTARLVSTFESYDQTVGITLTRDQVRSQYTAFVGSAFQGLVNPMRIIAPRSSPAFAPGGAQANYFQAYVDQTWSNYTVNTFTLTRLNVTFSGKVSGTALNFTRNPPGSNGTGPFQLNKPTTTDIVSCSGALANGAYNDTQRELGAEFCAAFNRGITLTPSVWWGSPSSYYKNPIKNDYAQFFHTIGLQGRAYAFPYDDINDQSSVQILRDWNHAPTSLTIGVGW